MERLRQAAHGRYDGLRVRPGDIPGKLALNHRLNLPWLALEEKLGITEQTVLIWFRKPSEQFEKALLLGRQLNLGWQHCCVCKPRFA
jgi:hypothetical protein